MSGDGFRVVTPQTLALSALTAALAALLPRWAGAGLIVGYGIIMAWLASNPRQAPPLQRPRRALLHDRYSKNKVPEDADVIVIGSGMGGLTCAAMLARMGRRVVVLEQHDVAGGGTHTFDIQGYHFDSGLHYTVPWSVKIMELTCLSKDVPAFDLLGEADDTFDKVVVGNAPPFKIQQGEKHLAKLYAMFPDEADKLDAYMALSDDMMAAVKKLAVLRLLPERLRFLGWKLFSKETLETMKKSAKEVLGKLGMSSRLQAVLCSLWIDTGGRPDEASFMMTAAVFRGLAMEGACYPRGSSSVLAERLVPAIEAHGGRVLVRASVDELIVADGVCCGVRLHNGDELYAPRVVSSVGYHNTMQKLLPTAAAEAKAIPTQVPGVKDSCGFVMLNLGLRGRPQDLGVTNANTWNCPVDQGAGGEADMWAPLARFFEDPICSARDIPMMITFPSMKDQSWLKDHPDQVCCQVLTMARYEWFERWKDERCEHRSEEYQELKALWRDRILERCFELFPAWAEDGVIEVADVSTPVTIEHYLRSARGGAVGLDQTGTRYTDPRVMDMLDPVTKVDGLYLTGQDTFMCGVTLAQLTGIITAFRMEGFLRSAKAVAQSVLFLRMD